MDIISIFALVFAAVAAFIVYTQLQGKVPEPVDFVPTSSPHKRNRKKKPEEKKPENFKWDAVDKSKKTRETDKDFNPIAAGKKMVVQAAETAKEEKREQLSDRQKNKLQSQGFVAVDTKPKGHRRSASTDASDDDEDAEDGAYSGMSAATAERLKLLEKIASGKRIGPDDGVLTDKKDKKKSGGIGTERRVDHAIVAERLEKEKQERKEAELAKTKVGGGKIAFQGAGAVKSAGTNAWARGSAPSPPAAEEQAPEADD